MRRVICLTMVAFGWASGVGNARAADRNEAEAILQRFLAHLAANTPVAGEFEVRTTFDPTARDRETQDAEKKNAAAKLSGGRISKPQVEDRVLLCRWAYDQDREMMETLPNSSNAYTTFYCDREYSCVGLVEGSFNLERPKPVPCYRPSTFYFMSGGMVRWHVIAADLTGWSLLPAPAGSPDGAVLLIGKQLQTKAEYRLLIDRESGVFHGYECFADSKLIIKATIQEFARNSDGRIFPKRAEQSLFLPNAPGRIYRKEELTAKRIDFPPPGSQSDGIFALNLPKGTMIADRLLNSAIKLDRPTDVQSIIKGNLPSHPFSDLPERRPIEVSQTDPGSKFMRYGYGVFGVVLAALAIWAVVYAIRRRQPK